MYDGDKRSGALRSKSAADHLRRTVTAVGRLGRLLYATYLGGRAWDYGRAGFMDENGNHLYLTGTANGTGWPTKNAYDSTFNGGGWERGTGDVILAEFNLNGIDSIPFLKK